MQTSSLHRQISRHRLSKHRESSIVRSSNKRRSAQWRSRLDASAALPSLCQARLHAMITFCEHFVANRSWLPVQRIGGVRKKFVGRNGGLMFSSDRLGRNVLLITSIALVFAVAIEGNADAADGKVTVTFANWAAAE